MRTTKPTGPRSSAESSAVAATTSESAVATAATAESSTAATAAAKSAPACSGHKTTPFRARANCDVSVIVLFLL